MLESRISHRILRVHSHMRLTLVSGIDITDMARFFSTALFRAQGHIRRTFSHFFCSLAW
jgi:hypothetical protein